MRQGAEFSPDRRYRYALWRIWNEDRPLVMFIGLNPSTANERQDDPTIRRVIRFAYDHGYGGVYMMNLFAFVTPYPASLILEQDPVGENDYWLEKIAIECGAICFAWGAFGEARGRERIAKRALQVAERYPAGLCLAKTKAGNPGHPLYLPGDSKMQLFKP